MSVEQTIDKMLEEIPNNDLDVIIVLSQYTNIKDKYKGYDVVKDFRLPMGEIYVMQRKDYKF